LITTFTTENEVTMAQRPVPDIDNPPPKRTAPEPPRRDKPEQPQIPTETAEAEPEIVYVGRRSAYARRAGCGAAVLVWILIMLIPVGLFILATQGEIRISHGNRVPDPASHPLLELRLLSEIRNQGLVITTSSVAQQSTAAGESLACVLTHVRYLLWEGEGENASYCDCYARPEGSTSNNDWSYTSTTQNTCPAVP
jgi:hypothetical protein